MMNSGIIGKYIQWLYWKTVYLFLPIPKEIKPFVLMIFRTRAPWWKFKPHVFRNPDSYYQWQVFLENDADYVKPRQSLIVDLHISQETGRIIGFSFWDSDLENKESESER